MPTEYLIIQVMAIEGAHSFMEEAISLFQKAYQSSPDVEA
jgi:hypothetical protein